MKTSGAAPAAAGNKLGAYPYVVVLILGLVYTFNYLDRQILAILAEPIKNDLGLTDTQIGMVSGLMFALFYTVFGIPIAWLADRSHRVGIVAAACMMWSVFCGLCGLAQNYVHLVLARIGVGIGEAGGASPSMSVISDYFPPHKRGGAIGLFSLGVPLGATIGVAFGAWVAAHYGWRQAFIAVALPGIFLSVLLLVLVKEPKRGRYDPPAEAAAKPASIAECVRTYIRTPTLSLLLLAAATYSFVFNAFGLGPLFVGALSQHFTGTMDSGAALTKAMLFVAPFYVPAIAALILVARALDRRQAALDAQAA